MATFAESDRDISPKYDYQKPEYGSGGTIDRDRPLSREDKERLREAIEAVTDWNRKRA